MLGSVLQVLMVMLLLAILGGVLLVFVALASLANTPGQLVGGVGQQAAGVVGRAAGEVQTAVQNATDPNHPPTGLSYDTEFAALDVWRVGEGLPGGNQYVVALQSIQRRQNAASPETALYAVMHAELRQPRETRVFGQVIHTDSDPHDYVLFQGESFRLAGTLYRVNWISQEEGVVAAGIYRHPDGVTAALKFDLD